MIEFNDKWLNLVDKYNVRGPRYTSYPTVPEWELDFHAGEFENQLSALNNRLPISLYIHLPYCKSRCWYCGCNSYITGKLQKFQSYSVHLKREIDLVSDLTGELKLNQLHLGGGTPTYFPENILEDILTHILSKFNPDENAEFSLEVDPRVTTDSHLRLLRQLGFRRISIGVQDLNPDVQMNINRYFSYDELSAFVRKVRELGFAGINIDLIYGLPGQNFRGWYDTLNKITELRPDRVATFGYAHMPFLKKHQQKIDEKKLPSRYSRLKLLVEAFNYFQEKGYDAIGIDHFALPEDELSQSQKKRKLYRNFMGYTVKKSSTLLGVGCSGISEFEDLYVQNLVKPGDYKERISKGKFAIFKGKKLNQDDRIRKAVINQIMCNKAIVPEIIEEEFEVDFVGYFPGEIKQLDKFIEDGLIKIRSWGFEITEKGTFFLRNIAMVFDAYLDNEKRMRFSKTI